MYVVSGFSRTVTVRLKADTTYERKLLWSAGPTILPCIPAISARPTQSSGG